jgi:hypothetical protein
MKLNVQARYLQAGDVIGSGETVTYAGRGAHTPAGKVEVWLLRNGRDRQAFWGLYTRINVERLERVEA